MVELHMHLRGSNIRKKRGRSHLARDAAPEKPTGSAWANGPIFDVIRVGPHEIYNDTKARLRHLNFRCLDADMAHRKMRPRAGFPAPVREREFGQGCGCPAKALRGHKALRHRLSERITNRKDWGARWQYNTYCSKVEVIKDAATCFPYRGATVLLLTLLSIGVGQRANTQGRRTYHKIHRPALSVCSRGSPGVVRSYRDSLTKTSSIRTIARVGPRTVP